MTNLTVSTDQFDPSVSGHVPNQEQMPYDRLDALRSAGALGLGFLDCDGGFVLIRECTALISCIADHGSIEGCTPLPWISSAVAVRDVMQCEP